MKKIVNTFYDIREGEWSAAGLMFILHFVLLVTLYFLKPARDSLFLIEIGPRQLPLMYILLAVVAIPVTQVLSRITQQFSVKKVIMWTFAFFMMNLLIIRWLLVEDSGWIYMLFYIWVGIFGILIISQFWLFANGLFDTAQSKRLFAFLNLGAILGAIVGSEMSSVLVSFDFLDTSNLLYVSFFLLAVCMIIIQQIEFTDTSVDYSGNSSRDNFQSVSSVFGTVYRSRYQLLIAGIIGMTMLASTLIDYQFKTIASDTFPETEDLTSFMGTFYGGLSIASLLIQILISAHIINRLGLGGAVMSRPAGLMAGAVLLAIEPVLASAIFLRGFDGATRYSIDKTGRELLFLPLTQEIKKKTKVFLDIFVDRFFRGIAGLLLLLLVYVQGVTVQELTYVVIAVVAVWLVLSLLAKKAYVNKFRESLQKRYVDADNIAFDLNESSLLQSVREMLTDSSDSRIIYALSLLEGNKAEKVADELLDLLEHQRNEIRLRVLKLFQNIESVDATDKVAEMLYDDEPEVRLEAIYYLCLHSGDEPEEVIQSFLGHDDKTLRAAAIGCVGKHGGDTSIVDEDFFEEMMELTGKEGIVVRAQLAQALAYVEYDARARNFLSVLVKDEQELVVREAIKSIRIRRDDRFIPLLLDMLKKQKYIFEIRKALASYGEEHLILYKQKFLDVNEDREVRRNIPAVFPLISSQKSVDHLMDMMAEDDPVLRYHVIKALNKLRINYLGDIDFSSKKVRYFLKDEVKMYFELLSVKQVQRTDIPNDILLKSLQEKMDQSIERLFRLCGLCYDPRDMHGAYLAYRSTNRESRAAAIEFMDNILEQEDRKYIFPVIDTIDEEKKLKEGRELFRLPVKSYEEGMVYLLDGEDLWLKACALFSISVECPAALRQRVKEAARNGTSELIRETAQYVLQRHKIKENENND